MTIIIIILFIAIGILLFISLYHFFEKTHSYYDDQYHQGFCEKCLGATSPDSCKDVSSYFFIGTFLACIGERCDICNSYIAEHRKFFLGITIKRYDKYRVKTVGRKFTFNPGHSESQFISRKLKKD